MHSKRYKWMIGLAIFFGLGFIGILTDLKTYSVGALIFAAVMTALFIFLAWKFKDERIIVPEPEEPEAKGDPTKKLERLVKMHKDGIITDEEFKEKKDKLMRQI